MSAQPKSSAGRCPICRKPATPEHAPFCSQGCRDRDLLNWLDGSYAVPGPTADDESGEPGETALDKD